MDPIRFDHLTRILSTARSRRHALAAALGAPFGMAFGVVSGVEAATKKKKPCPPCKKRKKGKCKNAEGIPCNGGTCQGGRCVPAATDATANTTLSPPPSFCATQPEGAPCGFCHSCRGGTCQPDPTQNNAACGSDRTGRCLNGVCNPDPQCGDYFNLCGSPGNPPCCSEECADFGRCRLSGPGEPCYINGACYSINCVGYRCVQGTLADGDGCNSRIPDGGDSSCASDQCGCTGPDQCTCRRATCGGPGATCNTANGHIDCCEGRCVAVSDQQGNVRHECVNV